MLQTLCLRNYASLTGLCYQSTTYIFFNLFYMYEYTFAQIYDVCTREYVFVCVNACGDQKKVSDLPEDGVTGTVST